jgi:endonuclease/exonuclease/phosphatase family metal-dependent hydrolase
MQLIDPVYYLAWTLGMLVTFGPKACPKLADAWNFAWIPQEVHATCAFIKGPSYVLFEGLPWLNLSREHAVLVVGLFLLALGFCGHDPNKSREQGAPADEQAPAAVPDLAAAAAVPTSLDRASTPPALSSEILRMNVTITNNTDATIEIPPTTQSHPLNPLPGVTAMTQRKHINLLALNIFLRPPLVKNNLSDHKDARLEEFIKLLPQFDIVCLEEMFSFLNTRKHKLIREAAKAGFLHYADSTSPSFLSSFLVDGGLLVLSRFPILATEFKPYPYGIFSDALSQKGILYVKIQVKDEIVHLFQTHTQASYIGSNKKLSIMTRGDQLNVIRTFMQECLSKYGWKENEMSLLVGDLNIDARNPFIEREHVQTYPMFKQYPHLSEKDIFNEYEAMMCILSDNHNDSIEDLLLKTYGEHPITYGDTYVDDNKEMMPHETVLTLKDDLCSNQSLDYIFLYTPKMPKDQVNPEAQLTKRKLNVLEGSARVEKFFLEDFEFTQISDHYGVMVCLEYSEELQAKPVKKQKEKHVETIQQHQLEVVIRLE